MHVQDEERNRRPPRLVVAFDDSAAGWGGLRHAASLVRSWGGSLTILHAVSPKLSTFEYGMRTLPKLEDARAKASALLAFAQGKVAFDLPSATEVLTGEASEVVPRRAAELEADVLVIGSRRRGTLDRLVFGSVGEAIVMNAAGPILIVPVRSDSSAQGAEEYRRTHEE